MTDNNEKINQLHEKLEALLKKQDDFSREVNILRFELNKLKNSEQNTVIEKVEDKADTPVIDTDFSVKNENTTSDYKTFQQQEKQEPIRQTVPPINKPPKGKSDLEKFIGENLINKIGIAITVIGVAIRSNA